jgi:hypothetical protein
LGIDHRDECRELLQTGAQLGQPLEAYKDTPVAAVHRVLADRSRLPNGDPAATVKVMIASVEREPAPKRLVLGRDSYNAIGKALRDRLADRRDSAARADSATANPRGLADR